MRTPGLLALILLALVTGNVNGAEVAKGFKLHKLGGGAAIQFPKKWKLQNFPLPPQLEMPAGSGEYRVQLDDLRMAITAIVYPDGGSIESTMPETVELLNKSMAQYAADSKESAVTPVEFTNGALFGAHGTLASKDGQPVFRIFQGPPYACVSTAIVRAPKATYSVSIGSGSCESESHKVALAAVAGMIP